MPNLTHVVPGEPFKPSASDWNTFVDTSRTVQSRRIIFKRGPEGLPEDRSCDCCPPCCATLWYVVGDEIIWTADFYKDVSQAELDTWNVGSVMPYAASCDEDSNGNVYQAGFRSAKLQTNLSRPQPPMWSLRSYSSDGSLQWSWAKYPYGYVSGSVRDSDFGTTKVRCGGANLFTQYAMIDDHCYVRRHDPADGTPIWDLDITAINTDYGDVSLFVGAGPTRLLFTGYDEATTHYPIIVLDHDGNFVWGEQTNVVEPVWIDDNDVQYGIRKTGTTPDGDKVASWDADGTFLNVPIIRDGFQPTKLRTYGDQLVCSNGTEIRLYTINGTGNYTQKVTTSEETIVFGDRIGSKNLYVTELRDSTDLSGVAFFQPPTAVVAGDDYLFADAMPTTVGTVWCGRRVCGKTLEATVDTPTTTSTTTSTTTGSTTTASTTTGSTTTASTTTGSTTTASTTTASTTTASTTTGSTTTGSTTTNTSTTTASSTSSTTAACTGLCDYQVTGIGDGTSPTGFYWFVAGNSCSSGCGCLTNSGGDSALATAIGRWPSSLADSAQLSCR